MEKDDRKRGIETEKRIEYGNNGIELGEDRAKISKAEEQ